jgi:hypothetical protein
MLGSVNPNAGSSASRSVEPSLPKVEVKAPEAPAQDSVEFSSISKQYQAYRAALSNEPDVRPDVMERIRAIMHKDKNFPPLLVLQGMGKLLGNVGKIQDTEGE